MEARTHRRLADMICGNGPPDTPFQYRSSKYLTQFFEDLSLDYVHHGETRNDWVKEVLDDIVLRAPSSTIPDMPDVMLRLLRRLMDPADAINDDQHRSVALEALNTILVREQVRAFYGEDMELHVRSLKTNASSQGKVNPHKPLSREETKRRSDLSAYLDRCSEDELIEQVLLPLLRKLGFQRVSVTGHKDKSLEYGKDLWMRYQLPTQQFLYFGIQAKKGKLDAKGAPDARNFNVAEIHQQALMMLGHEIFDPETNRQVLVDHAYIVAGGEITKAARSWIGNRLDASKRSQIMFLDRDDLLNLFCVTDLPVPDSAARWNG